MKEDVTADTVHTHTHTHGEQLKEGTKEIQKHNGIISLWKFIFSLIIVIYHFIARTAKTTGFLFKNGAIGVEFFFLVSGYLMARRAMKVRNDEKSLGEETIDYILKKVKFFFPYMLVALIISFFLEITQVSVSTIINSIWKLAFLEMSGVQTTHIMGQSWYIEAMLISMTILYPLIRKYKKNFTCIMAPIIVIFIGGWIAKTYGYLRGPLVWTGIVYVGMLRAFFELSLGVILYEICEKIKTINFNQLGRFVLTLIEILAFIGVIIATNIRNYDFIALALMSIAITLAFSEKTMLLKFCNNKLFYYLEKISLPIYLNHVWIIVTIKEILKNIGNVEQLAITLVITIIISMIMSFVIEKFKNKPAEFAKKLFMDKN